MEIISDLQQAIRNQFYLISGPCGEHQWLKDQHFIKREFTLYLAGWLDRKGVTLKPERYKALLLGLLTDIKTHGNTGAVKYWPGYLKHVLQQHLRHHGEEIYNEAKALRTLTENTLLALGTAAPAPAAPDPIRILAEHRRDLLQSKRSKLPSKSQPDQLSLL